MSFGMILLIIIVLLILFGILQRILDRMALTDRQALACAAAIFAGGFLPELEIGPVALNIGGALIPLGVCLYLLLHARTSKERLRSLLAAAAAAAGIFAVSRFFPSDPIVMPFDPMILNGVIGGLLAWIVGRSRRSAFVAGILGVILADTASALLLWGQGVRQTLILGGAGALDAIVLAGVTGVLLCELLGESMERISIRKRFPNGRRHTTQKEGLPNEAH